MPSSTHRAPVAGLCAISCGLHGAVCEPELMAIFQSGGFWHRDESLFIDLPCEREGSESARSTMFSRWGSCIQVLMRKVQYFAWPWRSEGNG